MPDDAATMTALADWATQLAAELGLTGTPIDVDAVLALASTAAHSVMRPAAPLTTFIAGYAAGLAAANGDDPAVAMRDASETAAELAEVWAASDSTTAHDAAKGTGDPSDPSEPGSGDAAGASPTTAR